MAEPRKAPVIDFHAHVSNPEVSKVTAAHNVSSGFGARLAPIEPGTKRWEFMQCTSRPERQIEDMDRHGIDLRVVSSSSVSINTGWAEPKLAAELDRKSNDFVAKWIEAYPKRFAGQFTLPLQDVERSFSELRHSVEQLGMKVANLPSQVGGDYISEPKFFPLWQAFQEHDITCFVHPHGLADPKMQKYGMWNGVGQPVEEAVIMAFLIYEGVLDRFPGLKIVIAHGGGYLPHYMGRLDRNSEAWPESMKNISRKPSEYLKHFYYDTCVYDHGCLGALVRLAGADRIVMGGDFPFGEADPAEFVRGCPGLSAAEVAAINGGNAARLMGI